MNTSQTNETTKPAFQSIRVDLLDRLLDEADKMSKREKKPARNRWTLQ